MLNRLISVIALVAITVLGTGCSNGGSGASNSYGHCASNSGSDTSFCLVSCSLGCSIGSCNVSDIAANQPIKLFFTHDVDPSSVDFNTVSIKTASGRSPEGRLDVSGNWIEFVPEIKVIGGVTSFGFLSGETYVLSLPDASESGFVLKSVSGDSLSTPLTCTLNVTQGIVDLDRAPPKATLLSPIIRATGVPANSVIILEFSEIIDIAGFQGSTTHTSPVEYEIRKTMEDPNDPTKRICDPNSNSKVIEGLPVAENVSGRNITVVTLRPAVPLPSQVCVRVTVTDRVHDLAGTPAEPHSFEFTTKILVSGEVEIREAFVSDGQRDTNVSSGTWSGGKALPPRIGGTGILGTFNAAAGKPATSGLSNHYIWNTDSQTIDGQFTPSGQPITVTGGRFEFSDFFLPSDFIIQFEGSNPAQIRVRGKCRVDGKIWINAPAAPYFLAIPNPAQGPAPFGQPAAPGGPGGAAGGPGGDSCKNQGPSSAFNGRVGSDVALPQGHGYAAQAVGTGGKGSPHFPASGQIFGYCALSQQFAGFVGAGGGGGGFDAVGGIGEATHSPCANTTKYLGTLANNAAGLGGAAYALGTFAPKTSGPDASLLHYTVGGSGGGGGGSHPFISRKLPVT
ncbi:MAG: Ig-like domain-containing protein, partial [Planctomycetota bacterium]|nr:Ig-like domain-containing protein [Planctomycetota bacterium]